MVVHCYDGYFVEVELDDQVFDWLCVVVLVGFRAYLREWA